VELTHGLACSYSCTDCGLQCVTFFIGELRTAYSDLHCIDLLLLVHTAIKDLDSDLKLVDLDLTVAGLETSLQFQPLRKQNGRPSQLTLTYQPAPYRKPMVS